MKEISDRELNRLTDIIQLFQLEQNSKQLTRFLNRLKALNKKYDTNQLRRKVTILIDLLIIKSPNSAALKSLRTLLNVNFDVSMIGRKVVGLYASPDQQLVPLPVPIHIINGSIKSRHRVLKVEFPGFEEEEITHWQNLGFYEAISLPYEHREIAGISVLIVKELFRSHSEAREYGFSPAVLVIVPRTIDTWRLVEQSIKKEKSIPERISARADSTITNRSLSKWRRSIAFRKRLLMQRLRRMKR